MGSPECSCKLETNLFTNRSSSPASCLLLLASLSLPAGPWPPCVPCALPPQPCTHPPPRLTLIPLLCSSELELPPLELLDLEQELAPSSDLSSSATPGTLPLSNSFSHMPFWDSLCPRPWVSSA